MTSAVDDYDDLPDGVLVADEVGRVVVLNRSAQRLTGCSPEVLGTDFRQVLPLYDEQDRDWWTCTDPYDGFSGRDRQPERRLHLVRDGMVVRDLLVTASYVREGTRLVRLVVALRDTRARDRVERSRADLVSTVAHELRSPLTSVKGFTATLLAKWDRFNDDQKKVMLETVNADADRVTRLLSELLDVSRIDAGRLEMRKQVVDLEKAIRKSVAGFVASGEPTGRFVVEVTGELPEMWLDPDKVAQVINNLVENALRHGSGMVTLRLAAQGNGAEVRVGDEGEGVAEDMVARVFARFWRGGNRRGGTGLGLYIVKGLVEAHGGRIEVGRSPSGGAEFRFLLPAGKPPFEA